MCAKDVSVDGDTAGVAMCDDDIHQFNEPAVSRRAFTLSAAALAALSAAPAFAADEVVEKDVMVRTPDGTADAALFYPAKGKHPAVLRQLGIARGATRRSHHGSAVQDRQRRRHLQGPCTRHVRPEGIHPPRPTRDTRHPSRIWACTWSSQLMVGTSMLIPGENLAFLCSSGQRLWTP